MSEARKLAAILVADFGGYSRLAAADEGRTLAHLRGLRSDLMDPATAAHHGRSEERVASRENASLSSRLRRFPPTLMLTRPAPPNGCLTSIGGHSIARYELPLGVELTRSSCRRGMTGICAFETFERGLESTFSGHCRSRLRTTRLAGFRPFASSANGETIASGLTPKNQLPLRGRFARASPLGHDWAECAVASRTGGAASRPRERDRYKRRIDRG